VVDVAPGRPAVLACAVVSRPGLSFLRHPVRPAMMDGAPLELGMQFPDAVSVPTTSRAELGAAECRLALGPVKDRATPNAGMPGLCSSPGLHAFVLTGGGAALGAAISRARGRNMKRLCAGLTDKLDGGSHAVILPVRA
jgi:hypothetical protein